MEAQRIKRGIVDQEQRPVNKAQLRQGPFLQAFLKTDGVWDDADKTEWADDVERRLRDVTAQLGYAIQRFENNVALFTLTHNELSKLARGQLPCWDEIVKDSSGVYSREDRVPRYVRTSNDGGNGC